MNRRVLAGSISTLKRLSDCGRAAHGSHVTLRMTDGHAGVAGLMTCGSVWACSVCSAKIAQRRQDELHRGLNAWWGQGGHVVMSTLTMRHRKSDSLATLWDALSYAWGKVTAGSSWLRDKADFAIRGYVRVVELTHGRHGWHVHIHTLLLLNGEEPTSGDLTRLKGGMVSRWVSALDRKGLTALDQGQDMRLVGVGDDAMADYFTKSVDNGDAIASEIAWGAAKRAKGVGGRTPFGILDDVIKFGEVDDVELWNEYEQASKGRRQMTWGRGTRDLLGLGDEATDEEIADEEVGTQDDDVIVIPRDDWFRLSRSGDAVSDVLDALEMDGKQAALALLHLYGCSAESVTFP